MPAEFTVSRDGLLIVAAPGARDGGRLAGYGDADPPPHQAEPLTPCERDLLPEPLADPLQDIRVNQATAEAYFVRAGEYIQIIDVAGRQCTDFQCFAARKLDKGLEHPLDVTTTRTLMGQSYPLPGLLLQILRSGHAAAGRGGARHRRPPRCLRACLQRALLRRQGYPGHVNCTDNFNGALAPYGIAARNGWMALNFFYNTGDRRP